ncbi:MAG TPA: hypothetical protein VKE98_18010 [Gemmataceae bacterium]|nr:hypothetical protein [Gemmataceae bacterium]
MSITLTCQCGKTHKVKSKYAGKKFLCDSCNQVLFVPGLPQGEPDSENDPSENQETSPPDRQGSAEHLDTAKKPMARRSRRFILWGTFGGLLLIAGFLLAYFFILRPESDQEAKSHRPTHPKYQGFHDVTDSKMIFGWAWDANQPDSPISVDIYDGDKLLATVKADVFRQDLKAKGKPGKHGFRIATPASLKDGKPHSVRIRYAGTKADLVNTPKVVTLLPE